MSGWKRPILPILKCEGGLIALKSARAQKFQSKGTEKIRPKDERNKADFGLSASEIADRWDNRWKAPSTGRMGLIQIFRASPHWGKGYTWPTAKYRQILVHIEVGPTYVLLTSFPLDASIVLATTENQYPLFP